MSKRILLIDDDPIFREIVKDMLETLGCVVGEAETGEGGIASFASCRPDLTITDIRLGGTKSGIETIAQLRRCDQRSPIVAVSGGGSVGTKTYLQLALESGASGTLQKPVRIEDLERLISGLD